MEGIKEYKKKQHLAIEMVDELTHKVVSDKTKTKVFCELIKENIINKTGKEIGTYKNVLIETLKEYNFSHFSNFLIRSAACNILRTLSENGVLSQEERAEIGKKVKQGGGTRGVEKSQQIQNIQALSDAEKELLKELYDNPEGFKRGSTRDIKKIKLYLEQKTGIKRLSHEGIKSYINNLNPHKKQANKPRNNPEENALIKKLFEQYFSPDKKLPTKLITEELNKHGFDRNINGVENYIRNHLKTPDQKQIQEPIWHDEEKIPMFTVLQEVKDNRKEYSHQTGKQKGSYNRTKIYQRYKELYPQTTRTQRALEHQIKKHVLK